MMPPKRLPGPPKALKRGGGAIAGPSKPKIPRAKTGSTDFSIIIDTAVLNEVYGANLTSTLAEGGLKYEIRNQLLPQMISFERTDLAGDRDEENIILLILKGDDVISWIEQDTLIPTIKSYGEVYPDKKISLLIFGFRKFLRGGSTKLSRVKIEMELTRLQIHTKCSHRLIEKPDVLADTLVHFGKSVMEMPEKKRKNALMEKENFYFENDNKNCVKVLDTVGLSRLWQQHLIKLPFITLETAEAIMAVYPMPRQLLEAFKNSSSPETLLRDIPFRRGDGPLQTNRRMGPEMSRKIFQFYHSLDPHELLHS